MTRKTAAGVGALVVVGAVLAWALFVALPRWYGPAQSVASVTPAATEEAPVRKNSRPAVLPVTTPAIA